MIPGPASHTYGTAFTQCIAVATMPRLRTRPLAMSSGWKPWKIAVTGGSPSMCTSKRSRSGPNDHAGSRCSSPMSQFTAAVITGSPSTSPSHRKRWAATRPGSITPMGESIGAVATAISCVVRSRDRGRNPARRRPCAPTGGSPRRARRP